MSDQVKNPEDRFSQNKAHLALIRQAVSEKKMFGNNGHIYVNNPGAGQPPGIKYFH